MRKKLETLPLSELKAIAKENKLKNVSTLRKAELIDALCALHESGREKEEMPVERAKVTEEPVIPETKTESTAVPQTESSVQSIESEVRKPRE